MSKAAQVYAQGLYSLAQEENLTKTILEEMTVLRQSFSQEPMFLRLLSAPTWLWHSVSGSLMTASAVRCTHMF